MPMPTPVNQSRWQDLLCAMHKLLPYLASAQSAAGPNVGFHHSLPEFNLRPDSWFAEVASSSSSAVPCQSVTDRCRRRYSWPSSKHMAWQPSREHTTLNIPRVNLWKIYNQFITRNAAVSYAGLWTSCTNHIVMHFRQLSLFSV